MLCDTHSADACGAVGCCRYDPRKRITADQALAHEYFAELRRVPEPSFSPVAARKASTGSTAHRPTSDSTGGAGAAKPIKHTSPKHASMKSTANAGSAAVAAAAASLTSPQAAASTTDSSLPQVAGAVGAAAPTTLPKRNKGTRRTSTDKRKGSVTKSLRRGSDGAAVKKPPVTPLTLERAPADSPTHGEDRAGSPFNPQDSQDSPTNAALKRARRHKRQKEREARRAAAAAAAAAAEAAEAAAAVVAAAAKHRAAPDAAAHLSPRDPLAASGGPLDLSGSFPGIAAGAGAGAGAGGSMAASGDFSNVKTGISHRKHRNTHRSLDGSGSVADASPSHASTRRRRDRQRHRDKERRRDRSYDDDSDGGGGRRRRRDSVNSTDTKRSSTLPAIDGGSSTYHGPDATNESLPPIHGQSSKLYQQRSPVAANPPGGHTFTHRDRDRSTSPTAGKHRRGHHAATDPNVGHQYKSYNSPKHYRSPKHAGSTGYGQPSHTGRSKYEHRNRKYSQPKHSHRQVGHGNRGAGGQQALVGLAAGHPYNPGANTGTTARRRNKHVRSRYATYFSDKRGTSNPVVKKKPGLLSVHGTGGARSHGATGDRLVSINAPKHNYHLPRGAGASSHSHSTAGYRQFRM